MGGANTVVSEFAASVVAAPTNGSADLAALQAMVAQLATTVVTLSKINRHGYGDNGGGIRGGDKRKQKGGRGSGIIKLD